MSSIHQDVNELLSFIQKISESKRYWLIRTQSGEYYSTFKENGFVGIDHSRITLQEIEKFKRRNKGFRKGISQSIKDLAEVRYPEDNVGLIAGQITKFVLDVSKGDIVIIPSTHSDFISFGEVIGENVFEASKSELSKTQCDFVLRRNVKWIKSVSKYSLDPYLFRMLQAHQAINDITKYAEIIERSLNDFYYLNNEANFVLEVQQENDIPAVDLFGLGYELLKEVQGFIEYANITELSINDVDVKLNINSKGKIQFRSPSTKTIALTAIIFICVVGGGFEWGNFKLGTPGLIKGIRDYLNEKHDRDSQNTILKKYSDSLNIKTPDDAVKVLKQFSTNKDNPK